MQLILQSSPYAAVGYAIEPIIGDKLLTRLLHFRCIILHETYCITESQKVQVPKLNKNVKKRKASFFYKTFYDILF